MNCVSVDLCVHRYVFAYLHYRGGLCLGRCCLGVVKGMVCCVSLYSCANQKCLQGEEAKNIPGESVTEEHYMDRDGNLVSRKVMYNFIFHFPFS